MTGTSDRKIDAAIMAKVRKLIGEEMGMLQNMSKNRDRGLKEFAVMMRVIKRIAPEYVDRGEFDSAAAIFGLTRDEAVRDPLRWGGSDLGLCRGELIKIAAGASTDVLVDDYGLSARAASKEVSSWLSETQNDQMSWKTITNWQSGGREGSKPGRQEGMLFMARTLREMLHRRVPVGDQAGAKEVLKESLITRVRRVDSFREAASK